MKNSDYALRDWQELRDLMQEPGFLDYARKVYDYIEFMPPGTTIRLIAPPDRLPWLIKITHAFLKSGQHWHEYDFNDDMTKFRRLDLPRDWEK